jgi:hypothetical protein
MATLLTLPAEIRALIYDATLPRRVITITSKNDRTGNKVQLHGRLLPPTTFQVCQQMREESLTSYVKCEIKTACCYGNSGLCGSCSNGGEWGCPKQKTYVYISYTHDTIYIPGVYELTHIVPVLKLDITKIRSLAISLWDAASNDWYRQIGGICKGMNLEKLLFVVTYTDTYTDDPKHHFTLELHDLELEYDVKAHLSDVKPRIFDAISKDFFQAYADADGCKQFGDDNQVADKNCAAAFPWSLARREYDEPSLCRKCTIFTRLCDNSPMDDFSTSLDFLFI